MTEKKRDAEEKQKQAREIDEEATFKPKTTEY
jgi:hypothetical protein